MSDPREYRKTATILAMRYDGGNYNELRAWAGHKIRWCAPASSILLVATNEGELAMRAGDWLARGIAGEFYPIAEEIFEETYKPVETQDE